MAIEKRSTVAPLIFAAILILAGGVVALLEYRSNPPSSVTIQPTEATPPAGHPISPVEERKPEPRPTVEADVPAPESNPVPVRVGEVDLDLDAIATALSRLKLNEQGQLQLDEHARASLNAAFLQSQDPMNEEQFSDLEALILTGLPGDAGRQAAAVAQRYYHYSNAYRDTANTFERLSTPEDMERGFQQLSRLRRDHLGEEIARALFGEEERMIQYTLESMRIQLDRELSAEEKNSRQKQLQQQINESSEQQAAPD